MRLEDIESISVILTPRLALGPAVSQVVGVSHISHADLCANRTASDGTNLMIARAQEAMIHALTLWLKTEASK